MTRTQTATRMLVPFLVLATLLGGCSSPADPPGTPVRRSIERIHKNTTPQPGRYYSVGYQTYLKGVAVGDLFKVVAGKPELSERTARFTHVEPEETACLEYVFPSTAVGTLLGGAGLKGVDYAVMNTTAHARHHVYYEAEPDVSKGRSWESVADFQRGVEVAVYDLVDETDAIDPLMGVGTGTVIAVLRKSTRVTLPSGATLDFAAYGERLLAEFLFQAKPVPPISDTGVVNTLKGAIGSLVAGTAPAVESRFRDSGIWLTMPAGFALPPELSATTPCPPR